jgi:hypothetical protein
VNASLINASDPGETERTGAAFARPLSTNAGLIVTGNAAQRYHYLIVMLAARYKVSAVYNNRFEVTSGA